LQVTEGKSFFGAGVVEVVAEIAIDGGDEGEKKGVQVAPTQVSGGDGGDGSEVENETVWHGLRL